MKRLAVLRKIRILPALALLAVAAPGCLFPTGSDTSTFVSDQLHPVTAIATKAWQTPVFADYPSLLYSANVPIAGRYNPIALASSSVGGYFAVFSQNDSLLDHMIAMNKSDFSYDAWWMGSASQWDFVTPVTNPSRPLLIKDSSGLINAVFLGNTGSGSLIGPYACRYTVGGWTAAVNLSDIVPEGIVYAQDTAVDSVSAAANAQDDLVVLWTRGTQTFYNVFRSYISWLWGSNARPFDLVTGGLLNDTASFNADPLNGTDIVFLPDGSGYATMVGADKTIYVAKWYTDQVLNFKDGLSVAVTGVFTDVASPKLFVGDDGLPMLIFYGQVAGVWNLYAYKSLQADPVGAMWLDFTATNFPGLSNPTPIAPKMSDQNDTFKPVLKRKGSYAVLGVIEQSVGSENLVVFRYANGLWGRIGRSSTDYPHVTWADLDINSNGDVMVVYSATTATGTLEHVVADVYTQGAWLGATQLDSTTYFAPVDISGGPAARARPSVLLQDDGTAMASFSMPSTAAKRRAAIMFYR